MAKNLSWENSWVSKQIVVIIFIYKGHHVITKIQMNYLFFQNKKLFSIVKTLSSQYTQIKKMQRFFFFFFGWHPQFKRYNHKNKDRDRIKETDGDNVSPIRAPAGKWVL